MLMDFIVGDMTHLRCAIVATLLVWAQGGTRLSAVYRESKSINRSSRPETLAMALPQFPAFMASTVHVLLLLSSMVPPAYSLCRPSATVLQQNFDQFNGTWQNMTVDLAQELFPAGQDRLSSDPTQQRELTPGYTWQSDIDRLQIGNGQLRMMHPAGCSGARSCGVQLVVRLPKPMAAATLSYKVKFQPEYDWTSGGKLPGLCSEDCPTGCKETSNTTGWSNRLMFRPEGAAVSYTYFSGKTKRCGDDLPWDAYFIPNQLHEVIVYIKLNSPGARDGVQTVWLDAIKVGDWRDLMYVDNPEHHLIERLVFHNYHGGRPGDVRFYPSHDQLVWFDDFRIEEGECPPDPSEANDGNEGNEGDEGHNGDEGNEGDEGGDWPNWLHQTPNGYAVIAWTACALLCCCIVTCTSSRTREQQRARLLERECLRQWQAHQQTIDVPAYTERFTPDDSNDSIKSAHPQTNCKACD